MSNYDEIAACAAAYHHARQAGADLRDVAAAVAILEARVTLAECLVRAGWTPSPVVQADLVADRALLQQSIGAWEQQVVGRPPVIELDGRPTAPAQP